MESFRVRNADPSRIRKLLMPMNFDACSLGLLHVLSRHIRGQSEKTGRTGYALHILITESGDERANFETLLSELKTRYSEHDYHSGAISEVLRTDDLATLFSGVSEQSSEARPLDQQLEQIIASLQSATARQDTLQILKQRLVVQAAKQHGCEAVIWTDSTTRLAERTLAETAKGRGYTLPWVVADGDSPHGIPFYFPLRELLTHEIEAYVSFLDPPFENLPDRTESKPIVSTKNTTIDDLMGQYFATVEQEYPSIVANVVRTTSKLQAPSLTLVEQQCELCNMPLEGQAPERSRLCYGCIRNIPLADT